MYKSIISQRNTKSIILGALVIMMILLMGIAIVSSSEENGIFAKVKDFKNAQLES